MDPSLPGLIGAVPRRNVAKAKLRGEVAFNKVEKAHLGPVIAAMLGILGMTGDQMGRELGYGDSGASVISKWINEQEPPQILRICASPVAEAAFIKALAKRNKHFRFTETIEIERTA